jgi:ABC-type phosphate transport system substrate-binding protein
MKKTILSVATLAFCASAAHADVAVIVSSKSTAGAMSADEVSQIYLGKSTSMKPIDIAGKSPVRSQFYSKVTGKDEAQIKAIWSKLVFTGKATPPKAFGSDADVVQAVAADPSAIGYVDKSSIGPSVKVILEPK